jgi:hypothetical protein
MDNMLTLPEKNELLYTIDLLTGISFPEGKMAIKGQVLKKNS